MRNKYFGTDGIRTVNQGNITGEKFSNLVLS